MLLTIAVVVAFGVVLMVAKARAAVGARRADLGWMSTQWLAEYRASHLS